MQLSPASPTGLAVATLFISGCAVNSVTNTVVLQANDYAYTGPDSLPAGPTAFGLSSVGKVPHEVDVVRLRPHANMQEILRLDCADSTWRALRDDPSGILTADP